MSESKPTNWVGVGSLLVGVIFVFGGIFGFLFTAQSNSTADALAYGSGESALRHRIQAEQIEYLVQQQVRLSDKVTISEQRQAELNLYFTREDNK